MIPLAHVIARRRWDEQKAREIVDHSPYPTRPLVGLHRRKRGDPVPSCPTQVGELLEPNAAYVDIHVTKEMTTYKIMLQHPRGVAYLPEPQVSSSGAASTGDDSTAAPSPPTTDFYFPVSECGKLKNFKVTFNQLVLQGEMLRVSTKDSHHFIPSSEKDQFLGCDSDNESSKQQPPETSLSPPPRKKSAASARAEHHKRKANNLYYYRVPFIQQQLLAHHNPAKRLHPQLDIYIEVQVKTIERDVFKRYRVLFPLLCLPISPSSLRCDMEMPSLVRRVWTTNARHRVHPVLHNNKAEFSLIFSPNHPLHLQDYLFDVEIELGEPIVPECMDPISLMIMITAVGLMVFFLLTKDLQDFE